MLRVASNLVWSRSPPANWNFNCGHFMSHEKSAELDTVYAMTTKIRQAPLLVGVFVIMAVLTLAQPVRAFIFDNYGDGFWTVINQGNGNTLTATNTGASQAVAGTTPFQQQFELLYNLEDGTFRLRHHDSWLCLGALNGATTNGTPVVTVASYTGASSQRWNFISVGGGNFQIVNVASGLALQTDNGSPAKVTLAPTAANNFQYWHFAYQTHYPKKGLAGWDDQWPRFNVSWGYNWGWGYGFALPAKTVFEIMRLIGKVPVLKIIRGGRGQSDFRGRAVVRLQREAACDIDDLKISAADRNKIPALRICSGVTRSRHHWRAVRGRAVERADAEPTVVIAQSKGAVLIVVEQFELLLERGVRPDRLARAAGIDHERIGVAVIDDGPEAVPERIKNECARRHCKSQPGQHDPKARARGSFSKMHGYNQT